MIILSDVVKSMVIEFVDKTKRMINHAITLVGTIVYRDSSAQRPECHRTADLLIKCLFGNGLIVLPHV
jgi:hypothetical protein